MIALPIPNSVKFNIVKILANNPSIERYSIPKSFKNIDLVIKDNKNAKICKAEPIPTFFIVFLVRDVLFIIFKKHSQAPQLPFFMKVNSATLRKDKVIFDYDFLIIQLLFCCDFLPQPFSCLSIS